MIFVFFVAKKGFPVANRTIQIHPQDNVAVAVDALPAGAEVAAGDRRVTVLEPIPAGHKLALTTVAAGAHVVKYGFPIGHATQPIPAGAHVHTHNLKTNLSGTEAYEYQPESGDGILPSPEPPGRWQRPRFLLRKQELRNAPAVLRAVISPTPHPPAHFATPGYSKGNGSTDPLQRGSERCENGISPIPDTFDGFVRAEGGAGVRNEVWIVPTVGCVNAVAEALARAAKAQLPAGGDVEDVVAFPHPHGCSQLGEDHEKTRQILSGLVRHPNAGGVLVLGLGCENNTPESFRALLGGFDPRRVKFLVAQDVPDEITAGAQLLDELITFAGAARRQPVPVAALRVGLKCGGSDGFSGITANPLLGVFSDRLLELGGTSVLTEVPEMFGAERLLMARCADRAVFDKCVRMVNGFKDYFLRHHQVVYENPSPGNKAGGITTLEEKSLGCTQKGGTGTVTDVLDYGERVTRPGLNLLTGPGNDIVAATALAAAGCQIILFTTGRGTPLGAPVPVIKVATNSDLTARKPNWIDFDAGPLLAGTPMPELADAFFRFVLATASGRTRTRNETRGFRDLAIFKDGVTL